MPSIRGYPTTTVARAIRLEQILVTHIVAEALGIRSAHHLAQVLSEDEPLRDLCGYGLTAPTARTLQRFRAAIEREPELRDAAHELGESLYGSAWWSGPRPSHIVRLDELAAVFDPAALVDALLGDQVRNRTGQPPEAMWRAYLARHALGLPDLAALVRRLEEDRSLVAWCGLGGNLPHRTTFLRFGSLLAKRQDLIGVVLDELIEEMHERVPDYGKGIAVDSVAIDAFMDIRREPSADSDARSGSAQPIHPGSLWGYRAHAAVCAATGLPLIWTLLPVHARHSSELQALLDQARERHTWLRPEWVVTDRAHDSVPNIEYIIEMGAIPVMPTPTDLSDTSTMLHDGTPLCACGVVMEFVDLTDQAMQMWRCPRGGVIRHGLRLCRAEPVLLDWRDNPRRTPPLPRSTAEFGRLLATSSAVADFHRVVSDERAPVVYGRGGLPRVTLHMRMTMLVRLAREVAALRAA